MRLRVQTISMDPVRHKSGKAMPRPTKVETSGQVPFALPSSPDPDICCRTTAVAPAKCIDHASTSPRFVDPHYSRPMHAWKQAMPAVLLLVPEQTQLELHQKKTSNQAVATQLLSENRNQQGDVFLPRL